MNARRAPRYVDLSGYIYSGKSAVTALLREFNGYHVPDLEFEFELLRIQGGILDLEDAVCNNWSPVRSDAAIRRFRRLVRRLGAKNSIWDPKSWFSAIGTNYDEHFAGRFFSLSETFLGRLVDSSWKTDWPYPMADLSDCELFVRKLMRKLGFSRAYDFEVYLALPEDFVAAAKEYLQSLLCAGVGDDIRAIVMHNAFEPFQPQRCLKYFDDVRCIIVDRDVRDMYVQAVPNRTVALSVEQFIRRHRAYRQAIRTFSQHDPRILRIQFELLVDQYEKTVELILDHLGEAPSVHVQKKAFFSPAVSRRNMGIWKAYPKQSEIRRIEAELGEFCYDL